MSKKIDRAMRGPGWAEVIIGAVLSIVLGVVLGAVLLVLRPVETPKSAAKQAAKDAKGAKEAKASTEPDKRTVVYLEGSRDPAKAKQADAKRKAFAQGQSVTVTEDELNVLAAPAPAAPAAAPKPAEKGKAAPKTKEPEKTAAAPAAGSDEAFATGAPNFRIDKGVLQVGVPVTVNALGLGEKIIVQARGGFVKKGDQFVYDPDVLYFGSCPVQRLPFVCKYVRDHFLAAQPIPDDIKAAWPKLANVSIEGNALKLTMP